MAHVDVNPDFWRGRNVLVTGHTGFKGSWLSLWLYAMKARVSGFALDPPTSPSLFERAHVADIVDDARGDVRDIEALSHALAKSRPDVVFHLAAQSVLRESYVDPIGTVSTNVMGTLNVLEAVRQFNLKAKAERSGDGVRSLVIVTSDKCYENREWVWGYRENEAMGGHDPYSTSKGCAELLMTSYNRSFAEPAAASARAGNVIGGGDWAKDRIVPDAVRAFAIGRALEVRRPRAIRPWQHVLEPLSGYLLLAEALSGKGVAVAEGWNFGPGPESEQPVESLVDTLAAIWGDGAQWLHTGGDELHEATFLKLDSSKARTTLGWRPRLGFRDALKLTADWYKADLERPASSMQEFTLGQIRDYCRAV
ncbi:CDP-glucose 4,6-dehydratase [Bradyrhizobium genosp. B]|uniref:CDP-glucose 4,6-dehydratase n=1 Tax=Bradyrhizobium commune TaxID=83627 RepID=A0A7S9H1N8_9BRAD|nr:CDP-glucose 4,6-dehydratase [Bradyrhizobium commune]